MYVQGAVRVTGAREVLRGLVEEEAAAHLSQVNNNFRCK